MNAQLTALLDELHHHGVSYDADKPDRLDRLRNLEPYTAALLAVLVRATGSRKVLELGTSNGYSTLWLADAAYWHDLFRAAKRGGLLAVDNVISHADQVAEFRALVSSEARVTEALAPTGAGLLLVVRDRAAT